MTGLWIIQRGSSLRKLSTSAVRSVARGQRLTVRRRSRCLLVEREVELEHVHAGLAEHAERAAVGVARRPARARVSSVEPAHLGDPVRLDPGVGLRDVRVDAGGRGGDRVDGDVGELEPGRELALAREVGLGLVGEVAAQREVVRAEVVEEGDVGGVAGDRGPRLEVGRVALEARAALGLALERLARSGSSRRPRRRPRPCEPSALSANSTCETPVVTSG